MKNDRLAFDRATVRTFDVDGRLHVSITNLSKSCVNDYLGSEVPDSEALGLDPAKIYKLFRDPVELGRAVASFNNLPLLSSHVPVSAADHRPDLVIGSTGSEAVFDFPYLKNSLVIWSDAAIAAVESGDQKELSSAYRYRAVKEPGTFEGQHYDLRMTDIVGNHVATVEIGRAGKDVVVADSNPFKGNEMTKKQRVIAAKAGARVALAGLIAQDANLSALDTVLDALAMDAEPDGDEEKPPVAKDADDDESGDDYEDDPDNAGMRRKKVKAAVDEDDDKKPEVTMAAMDAAIAKAVTAATKVTMARMEALHTARKEVAHMVGEVAMDSAEAVYKFALDHANVDTTDVHPSAYRALVKMAGAAQVAAPRVAMDAAATDSFAKRFPTAGKIIRS